MYRIAINAVVGIAFTAILAHAAGVQPEKRDLPVDHGCIPCKGGDRAYYKAASHAFAMVDRKLIAEGKASFGQTFEEGYQPKLCEAHGVNCVT